MENELKRLYELLEKISMYEHAISIVSFDLETIAPEQAKEKQSDMLDFLCNELFKITNSDEFKELVVKLNDNKEKLADPIDKILIKHLYEDYLKEKDMTEEMSIRSNAVFSRSRLNWLKARQNNDYSLFKDSLQEVLDISEELVNIRTKKLDNFYDNLLDDCEKGLLQEDLDKFFTELKKGLLDILANIKKSGHVIRTDFLNREVSDQKQREFGMYLLELIGYDFSRGLLQETEHPFTSDISQFDARVTTHFYKDMFASSLYSCVHEGGHGIFMQNEPEEDFKHYINDSITNGMHESVSRFYENVIGRSKEFVHLIYPKFKEIFSPTFDDISEREFYEGINLVKPDLIRTEADEVTYGLHIIIRYELEKKICNKEIKIEDLPQKWNQLYEEYLGVKVPDDRHGILQDVHWSGGFGYFPSYALGNSYNQMYLKKMEEEFLLGDAIKNGDFKKIIGWLKSHVFKEANHLDPKDWIKDITGESLTPKYFLEYLKKKYGDIYQF